MAAWKEVSRWLTKRALPVRGASTWVKRANSLGQPIRSILTDYADVFVDLFKSSWKRPFRTITYVSMGSLIVAAVKKSPDYNGYLNCVLEYANELSMCSDLVRSPKAKQYVDNVLTLHSDGFLSYLNLGIVSLIMRKPHSSHCSNFHETCPSLQPRVWRSVERVVDVGVWGRWLLLDTALKDYDINEDELSNSSNQH